MSERGGVMIWILWFIVANGVLLGALIGIGCAIGANACPWVDEQRPAARTVEELWARHCMVCHGPDGRGEPNPRAPSLVEGPSAGLTLEQLENRIARGSLGLMPRFATFLSDEEIEALTRYVLELREEASWSESR